ncbi:Thioesterase/thiol ester dehydrase-isomerase [Meredithblackwellia eburnea MCA 4105]
MSQITAELIEDAIQVEEIDRDLFRSKSLWKPGGGRGVFGGQTIAQAAWAATLAIRRDEPGTKKGLHSLHSYFLSFGNADIPVLYSVSRLRDGRSYSTRSVLATQQGVPIFTLSCSFCLPEPSQPIRAFPVPRFSLSPDGKVPEPETCLPTEDRLQKVLSGDLHPKLREYVERSESERRQSSIEVRNADNSEYGDIVSSKKEPNPDQMIWFRSRAPVRKDPAFQKCVLAYASDLSFIGTAARASGLGSRTTPKLGMLASLDHAMYFYDDTVDASEFLLYWMECPITSNGRGTVYGRIYKRDGTLAVLVTQEGVVRAQL